MRRARRKIGAALKAKIALNARAKREMSELYAQIGQLTVERDFLSKRSG